MVVFVTTEFTVWVTDKTPEMSTRPLNDASPDISLGAVTIPVNVGDSRFALKFKETSTCEKVGLVLNELSTVVLYVENETSTCEKLGLVFNDTSTCEKLGLAFNETSTCEKLGFKFKETSTCEKLGLVFNETSNTPLRNISAFTDTSNSAILVSIVVNAASVEPPIEIH